MAVSGTGKCLGGRYSVLLLVLAVQASTCSVDFASFQLLRSQYSPSRLVFGLYLCPTTILYSNIIPPFHSLLPSQCEHPLHVHLAMFSNFYEQQLVLGKLSSTVKWFTFCESFIHIQSLAGYSALKLII